MKAALFIVALFCFAFAFASATEAEKLNPQICQLCKIGAEKKWGKYCELVCDIITAQSDSDAEFFKKLKEIYNKWAPKIDKAVDVYQRIRTAFPMAEAEAEADSEFKLPKWVTARNACAVCTAFNANNKFCSGACAVATNAPLSETEAAFFKKIKKAVKKAIPIVKKGIEIYKKVKPFFPNLPMTDEVEEQKKVLKRTVRFFKKAEGVKKPIRAIRRPRFPIRRPIRPIRPIVSLPPKTAELSDAEYKKFLKKAGKFVVKVGKDYLKNRYNLPLADAEIKKITKKIGKIAKKTAKKIVKDEIARRYGVELSDSEKKFKDFLKKAGKVVLQIGKDYLNKNYGTQFAG